MRSRLSRWLRAWTACAGLLGVHAVLAAGLSAPPPGAQAGDLVFRTGTALVSHAVMQVDDSGFSHVGMLLGGPRHWEVLHATPSEVPGRPDGVVIDDFSFFTDPALSTRHVVYHVRNASAEQRALAIASARGALDRPFKLADPAGTYCTVLVWQAWRDAGLDLEVAFTPLALPLMAGDYLLPGPLAASTHLRALADTPAAPTTPPSAP